MLEAGLTLVGLGTPLPLISSHFCLCCLLHMER